MVSISHRPFKEVIIMDYVHYPSAEELARGVAQIVRGTGQPTILYWAEGVVFTYTPLMPENDELIKEYLNGRIYWISAVFALMPNYSSLLREFNVETPVIDVTPNVLLRETAAWLKNQVGKQS
ncbi:MAG: hypothetical protein ACE5KO_05950 [Candidatus Bathyarchaeia archaeon]